MKHIPLVLFLFVHIALFGQDQVSPDDRIVVLGEGRIRVLANRVFFSVTLSTTTEFQPLDSTYKKQKAAEQNLLTILHQLKIPKANIKLSAVNVSASAGDKLHQLRYYMRQDISFYTDSIALTARIQDLLIAQGCSDFRRNFVLKDEETYKQAALTEALTEAKTKAEILAKGTQRKLGQALKIMDTEETDPLVRSTQGRVIPDVAARNASNDAYTYDNLTDIPQYITLTAKIKVVYKLE